MFEMVTKLCSEGNEEKACLLMCCNKMNRIQIDNMFRFGCDNGYYDMVKSLHQAYGVLDIAEDKLIHYVENNNLEIVEFICDTFDIDEEVLDRAAYLARGKIDIVTYLVKRGGSLMRYSNVLRKPKSEGNLMLFLVLAYCGIGIVSYLMN